MTIVGVELSVDAARAVTLDAWRSSPRRTFEAAWDPSRPAELVALLRAELGSARRIALSVGLGFLHVKHVSLPPAPPAERRRILALEPDRFFPVQGEPLVVSLVDREDLAFAVDAGLLDRWITAFETWAPVETVEPSPVSLARALPKAPPGSWDVPAGPGERGLVELDGGRVRAARRVPEDAAGPGARPLPAAAGVSGGFLFALGAARGATEGLDAALVSDAVEARIRGRRLRRVSVAGLACVAAFALALWALDRSRERKLDRIREEVAAVETLARPAVELRDRLAALDREAAAIAEVRLRRMEPLRVLAALSERLPAGATVLGLRATGDEWQIDGRAADAAAILPILDRDGRFESVRFLSASARFREAERTYETFSIAFRVRP